MIESQSTAAGDGPLVSVIIVNYNVRDLLENCLHSLRLSLADISHEILVVDNNSDDGSAEMLRVSFPDVRLFGNSENVGFARANNIALAVCRGRFILLLNPDTLVQEDTIQTMLGHFACNPKTGMAGCKIITPSGALEPACRRSFPSPWVSFSKLTGLSALFPRSRLFARYNMTFLNEDETYEVDAISGSFMMLRREVYEQVGGLDESYFMYGEDLDWCHRIQSSGWKIMYVHSTRIIHYGGESTRRSSIDSQALFYRAMEVFAHKNLKAKAPTRFLIGLGIRLRQYVSIAGRAAARLAPVAADAALAVLALASAELLRNGGFFGFPDYAYPTVYLAAACVFALTQLVSGSYSGRDYPVFRSAVGAAAGFLLLSSVTYFFKEYAFSRFVVILAGGISFFLLPGWRLMAAVLSTRRRMSLITGRPTLLVGITEQALSVLDRLRRYEAGAYRIVGLIDVTHKHSGETRSGVEILGSVDNIGKVIASRGITDVIFAPDALSYSEILSIIHRTRGGNAHFRVVSPGMGAIIGKAGIDQISSVPLIDVDYNLLRAGNRFIKRVMDSTAALTTLIVLGPVVFLLPKPPPDRACSVRNFVRAMPAVLRGRKSLVGVPADLADASRGMYLGKPGITGLIQLRYPEKIHDDERLKLAVQYARNHSVFMDIEIMLRTALFCIMRGKRNNEGGEQGHAENGA